MKSFFIAFLFVITFSSCVQSQGKNIAIPLGSKKITGKESVATFSEGCFWHAEIVFQSLAGVRDAVSGYAGGTDTNPDYEKVSTGTTGHAETVQIYYDSSKISFKTLVDALFASMDPTQLNRQGNDEGTEYRSIAFYRNENEKAIIEAAIKKLTDSKKYKSRIVTEVVPFKAFYPAEDYHQEYIYYNPGNSYVQNVSIPEFLKFKQEFKGNFK
ncbi:MAG: peptide-methionine (S)-S-oxide reductase MsrA [Bacteroidota bacterium]|nr:peptide-methionine (S)-S-oxide reductase MsrA [Bacteroidota bacterium]